VENYLIVFLFSLFSSGRVFVALIWLELRKINNSFEIYSIAKLRQGANEQLINHLIKAQNGNS